MGKSQSQPEVNAVLGTHPTQDTFGCHTNVNDLHAESGVPPRALQLEQTGLTATISQLRTALICHHASPEMLSRDQRRKEALQKLGYSTESTPNRFPQADKTRKGNLAKVFFAEYRSKIDVKLAEELQR